MHIFISLTEPDCNEVDFSTFNRVEPPDENKQAEEAKIIEVDFRKNPTSVEVFPNPNSGKFSVTINLNNLDNAEYEIRDMIGRSIVKVRIITFAFDLDLSSLTKGIYLLQTKIDAKKLAQKIIIN